MTSPRLNVNAYYPARYNPWAPEWMTGIFTPPETPAGAEDRWYTYATPLLSVPLNSLASNQAIPVDNSADFLIRNLTFNMFLVGGGIPGAVKLRWRDGQANRITSQLVRVVDIEGAIFPELYIEHGTTMYFDIFNPDLALALNIQIITEGVKRYWK